MTVGAAFPPRPEGPGLHANALVTDLLRTVLRDIGTGAPVLPVVSPSVIVHRTDLQRILDPGKTPADVLARLRRALGEVPGV